MIDQQKRIEQERQWTLAKISKASLMLEKAGVFAWRGRRMSSGEVHRLNITLATRGVFGGQPQ